MGHQTVQPSSLDNLVVTKRHISSDAYHVKAIMTLKVLFVQKYTQ